MEEQKEQTKRYTKKELDLIKEIFKDNLLFLKAIRKVFLQIDLTEAEDIMIKETIKEDVMKIIRKSFLPTIDGDAPISQVIDLMMTVDIINKTPEEAVPHLRARELMISYITQQLLVLSVGDMSGTIKFEDLTKLSADPVRDYINLVARNTIVLHVETQIRDLNTLANQTELTEEEQEKIDKINSNK